MERVIAMVSMISVMKMVDKEQASDKENSTGLLECGAKAEFDIFSR